jgi:2-oxoisovalerate dehydrogenase E2 component (dihydrolipoyl transacylase)
MGARSIRLPDVGEGIAEAELVEWFVKVGDIVLEDQAIAAVMTDKATVEIPTPVGGTILALGGEVGHTMAIGSELVRIDVPGAAGDVVAAAPVAPAAREPVPAPVAEAKPPAASAQPIAARAAALPRPVGEKPIAAPSVRLQARNAGIDLRLVHGTGPAGRITHEDVERFAEGPAPAPAGSVGRLPNLAVEEIKVVGLRRRIAQNMAEATRRIAHFAYVEEIDVTALEELRAAMNTAADGRKPKLTLLPFLMLAITRAIANFPQMNAHYDDDAEIIRRFGAVHLGIATQTPSGLMVPVVRHVETRGVYNCAAELARLSEAARSGQATREELAGSTLTITSLGALGGIVSTPVINRPEVAIIGVNKIVMKPVWQGNGFVPRKMMNLSSSFDHRVIDGYDAAQFIQAIRLLLETPALIFIEG